MTEVQPITAAYMAEEVYLIQNERTAKAFIDRPEFANDQGNGTKQLTAKIGMLHRKATDAFGVFARGSGIYHNDLFLIFRGSTSAHKGADWYSNARIGVEFSESGLPVHSGFNRIFKSMLPEIQHFLSENASAGGTIHCIGHSLGGAVANLAADWIAKLRGNPVKLYTFGAPRPGIFWFARALGNRVKEQNIYRVYHKTDPVPMLPIYPYCHAPISNHGHQLYSSEAIVSAAAHDMERYRLSVRDSEWNDLRGSLAPFHIDHVIEQWLRSDTPANPSDSKIWEWLNSAIIWVLKKLAVTTVGVIQSVFVGAFTLADRLSWLLKTGFDLTKEGGFWVGRLLRKILQVLGMGLEGIKNATQAFIRTVLFRLVERMAQSARIALQRTFNSK